MIAGIDPSMVAGAAGTGPGWQIQGLPDIPAVDQAVPSLDGIPSVDGVPAAGGESFGQMLSNEIGKLADLQTRAAEAGTALANGTATDPVSAVVAVEKAQLSMQFASQIRTRGAEALSEIFRTQV